MSARSPRGSLSGASSADVAEDFRESLKDLQANNKYEISNLTIIAKENTEHAQAISKVLEQHIKTTAPPKKLVALYVLDSIVKNVGTPYNVYLQSNLYGTFMEAYTLVDQATRRNMEAIVKTWKEPVPGSMDPRPVFPHEVVQPIENALIKARTVALQGGRPATQGGYRNTPTPPQYGNRYPAPQNSAPGPPQPYQSYPNHQAQSFPHPAHSPFPPTPQQQPQHAYAPPQQQPVSDVEAIKRDVAALIAERQAQFGQNPHNQDTRTQLGALLQLQTLLNTQSLDAGSLQQIQRQISSLAAKPPSTPQPAPQPAFPPNQQWQPPVPPPQSQYPVHPPSLPYHQPASAQPQPQVQPAPPAIPPGALNGLQALLANNQKPSTPQMRAAAPTLQNASHKQLSSIQSHAAATPALNGGDLLASLSKSGLLPKPPSAQPTPPASTSTPTAVPTSGPQSTADLLKSLSGLLPPNSQTGTPTLPLAQLANTGKPRVPMTSAALKTFRPELVHSLYEAYPNQCSTCGRRFGATNEGRAKKDRHLDWHFRTNQRMADPNTNRGQHRNWYIPEIDWIKLTEFDPSTTTAAETAAHTADAAAKKKKDGPEDKFVRAPPGTTKATCSICFEEMKTSYSEELQDWIFPAATTYGGKLVHAQCLAEMLKGQQGGSLAAALGGQGQRQRSATPDSSLGKRKAESALAGAGARVRMQ